MEAPRLTTPKKLNRLHLTGKVIAPIFWDSQGMIMFDYLEGGRMINGVYYAGELRQLRQEIARKRREKLTLGLMLMQDNAAAHMSQTSCHDCMTAATKCGFAILPHPPYSTDMAPSDFYLFPNWHPILEVHSMESMKAP